MLLTHLLLPNIDIVVHEDITAAIASLSASEYADVLVQARVVNHSIECSISR